MTLLLWFALFESARKKKKKRKVGAKSQLRLCLHWRLRANPPFPINPCAIKSQFMDLGGSAPLNVVF